MSGGAIERAAIAVVQGLADRAGVKVDAGEVVRMAEQLVGAGVQLLDGHAKKKAEAAGDAAANAITTEDQAEAELRKP